MRLWNGIRAQLTSVPAETRRQSPGRHDSRHSEGPQHPGSTSRSRASSKYSLPQRDALGQGIPMQWSSPGCEHTGNEAAHDCLILHLSASLGRATASLPVVSNRVHPKGALLRLEGRGCDKTKASFPGSPTPSAG